METLEKLLNHYDLLKNNYSSNNDILERFIVQQSNKLKSALLQIQMEKIIQEQTKAESIYISQELKRDMIESIRTQLSKDILKGMKL